MTASEARRLWHAWNRATGTIQYPAADPAREWYARLARTMAERKCTKSQAAEIIVKADPQLHRDFVEAANRGR
jgi:hypothetical protein